MKGKYAMQPFDGNVKREVAGNGGSSLGITRASPVDYWDRPAVRPPHNLDAEQAVLGALLFDNAQLDNMELDASEFFDPLHARLYEVIRDTVRAGHRADPITLAPKVGHLEPVNEHCTVPRYLGHLVARTPAIAELRPYVELVRDLSRKRTLVVLAENLAEYIKEGMDTPDLVAFVEKVLLQITEGAHAKEFISLSEAVTAAIEQVNRAYQRGNDLSGLPTGLIDLDAKIGGLQNGDLIIIAGRPSMGKSSLVLDIAAHVAAHEIPVGGFSLEMSGSQLGLRLLSQRMRIASEKLRRGTIDQHQMEDLVRKASDVGKLSIILDETGGLNLSQIVSRARRMKRQHKIGLLFIDYLQLLRGSDRENRTQDIAEITMGLKALAKELEIPVICLSQLSRQVEQRSDKRPQLADLRDSGAIEQDSDIVLFVYREEYYVERTRPSEDDMSEYADWQSKMAACSGKGEIIIGKSRNGPTGIVPVAFDSALTRFFNLGRA